MAQNREGAAKRRRGPGRPFQKGNRANPGGRPKTPPEAKLAFAGMFPEALEALRQNIAKGDQRAIEYAMDRHLGKIVQKTETRNVGEFGTAELEEEARRLETDLGGASGKDGKPAGLDSGPEPEVPGAPAPRAPGCDA